LSAIKGRHFRCNRSSARTLATIYFEHGDDVICPATRARDETLDSVEKALTGDAQMSQQRAVDLAFSLQELFRRDIERGKITHLEALEAMLVVLSDMIADVPTEARRSELIEHVLACLKIDVADEARNRAIL
jgi:hypothetical protein